MHTNTLGACGVGTPASSPGALNGSEEVRPRGPKLWPLAGAAVDSPLCNRTAVLLEHITSLIRKLGPERSSDKLKVTELQSGGGGSPIQAVGLWRSDFGLGIKFPLHLKAQGTRWSPTFRKGGCWTPLERASG